MAKKNKKTHQQHHPAKPHQQHQQPHQHHQPHQRHNSTNNSKSAITEKPRKSISHARAVKCGICLIFAALTTQALLYAVSYALIYSTRHLDYNTYPEVVCDAPLSYHNISYLSSNGVIEDAYVNISGWFFEHTKSKKILFEKCEAYRTLCDIYNTSNNNATILVVHGHGVNKGVALGVRNGVLEKAVIPFLMAGYNVLAIDLRNHGMSEDAQPISLGRYEYLDVQAGIDWIRDQILHPPSSGTLDLSKLDADRIALWGESMGGATVLITAAHDNDNHISAIATESSFGSAKETFSSWLLTHFNPLKASLDYDVPIWLIDYIWRCITTIFPYELLDVRPVDMIENITCPMFIMHGREDTIVPFSHSGLIINAARQRKKICRKRTLKNIECVVKSIFYKGGHVDGLQYPEVTLAMIDFMEEYV